MSISNKVVVAVLSIAFISLSSLARANDLYDFSLTPVTGSSVSASGAFTLSNDGFITSVNGSMNRGGSDLILNVSHPISYITFGNFYAYFMNSNGIANSQITLTGKLNSSDTGYSGVVQVGGTNIAGTGFFEAMLSPGTGGSSPGSGGAPSPEVNTGLGVLLAAATFAFLRRKRDGRNAQEDA